MNYCSRLADSKAWEYRASHETSSSLFIDVEQVKNVVDGGRGTRCQLAASSALLGCEDNAKENFGHASYDFDVKICLPC